MNEWVCVCKGGRIDDEMLYTTAIAVAVAIVCPFFLSFFLTHLVFDRVP